MNKTRLAPCKDCPNRKITDDYNCHTDCKQYLEFMEENERIKKISTNNAILHSLHVDSCRRSRRKNTTRKKK